MATLPAYSMLNKNYPTKEATPTKQLFDGIGGEVRGELSDAVNTCAVRMSVALNLSGSPIRAMPGVYALGGAKSALSTARTRAVASSLYIIRVGDMRKYLEKTYGPGVLIYDANKDFSHLVGIRSATQGIVVFVWGGRYADFGATGHVDLLSVAPGGVSCFGHCYWWPQRGPMTAYIWPTQA